VRERERERESEPDVSITIGMFLSRANLKTFSSLLAIPSGLICKIQQYIGKQWKKKLHELLYQTPILVFYTQIKK
jgi:hypothetical protein